MVLIHHFKFNHLLTTKFLKLKCVQNDCNQLIFPPLEKHLNKQHPTKSIISTSKVPILSRPVSTLTNSNELNTGSIIVQNNVTKTCPQTMYLI